MGEDPPRGAPVPGARGAQIVEVPADGEVQRIEQLGPLPVGQRQPLEPGKHPRQVAARPALCRAQPIEIRDVGLDVRVVIQKRKEPRQGRSQAGVRRFVVPDDVHVPREAADEPAGHVVAELVLDRGLGKPRDFHGVQGRQIRPCPPERLHPLPEGGQQDLRLPRHAPARRKGAQEQQGLVETDQGFGVRKASAPQPREESLRLRRLGGPETALRFFQSGKQALQRIVCHGCGRKSKLAPSYRSAPRRRDTAHIHLLRTHVE